MGESSDRKTAEEALNIYKAWMDGRITYMEALSKIKDLSKNGKR